MAQWVKNLPAMQETQEMQVSVTVLEKYPGGGNGDPLQYSCLKNPMDKGAWWATVQRVAQSWTRLSDQELHIEVAKGYKISTISE